MSVVAVSLLVLFGSLMAISEASLHGPDHPTSLTGMLPEEYMNVSQMIAYNGYPVHNYDVITADGYILSLQRIPYGRKNCDVTSAPKPVVFLQHGLMGSSSNWVANLANQSLGFVLADACFDVWMGNVRGNTYSRRHVTLPVTSDAFWDFSFDEMAKYDLPAMISFVTKTTGTASLYYVGHSQGTMIGFIEFSRNPELVQQIKAFYALAPVTTVSYMGGALKYLAYLSPEIQDLFKLLGVRDFLPSDWLMDWMADQVCTPRELRAICADVIFLMAGYDQAQLNQTRLPVYVAHTPAGTSVKNMVHFAQLFREKKFQMYDYGSTEKNRQHYKQDWPPQYNVSAVTVPTALYWGGNDVLADSKDVASLMGKLHHQMYNKFISAWDHLDFIWAMDAVTLVYDDLIQHIRSLEKRRLGRE